MQQLYYAYIHSNIRYGIEVYGQATKIQIKKVQVQQNRAINILHNKDIKPPTRQLHKNLCLLMDIHNRSSAQFIHKY